MSYQRYLPFLFLTIFSTLVQAAESNDWQTDYSGSVRVRYNSLNNQFRPGLGHNDQALSFLTLLKAEASRGNWTVVGELEDARDYLNDEDSALTTIEINTLEPLQAYVQYQAETGAGELTIKGGRQTMDLGSRRLVARHRWRNSIANHNGIDVKWRQADGMDLEAFWVMPVLIRPADRAALLDNRIALDDEDPDLQLWGLYYTTAVLPWRVQKEGYLLGLNEQDDPGDRETFDRELLTPGIRLLRLPASGDWDLEVELTLQKGSRRASRNAADTRTLDVSSRFAHLTLGYTFDTPWQPRLALEADYGSGDDDPADANHERFDFLFGQRRADFGPTGIYGPIGRENIRSWGLRLGFNPSPATDGFISWRRNSLDSPVDSFSRTGVRDPLGMSGDDAGDQLEFRVRHWLIDDKARLEVGGVWFDRGEFLETAPNANPFGDPVFFYTDITWRF